MYSNLKNYYLQILKFNSKINNDDKFRSNWYIFNVFSKLLIMFTV